jgi:metal-responsive CopG/Arc/MetJ family transcriptional regulator
MVGDIPTLMKKKISICLEENTLKILEKQLSDMSFRSRSHLIEFAINNQIKEGKNNVSR